VSPVSDPGPGPWTLERVEREAPALAPLVSLHRVLAERSLAWEAARGAFHPRFRGVPAVHWLAGTPLLAAAGPPALLPGVAELFAELADALAGSFPAARGSAGELLDATAAADFPWEARLLGFRESPAGDVPHPELFRFLLMRALAVPAGHLAVAVSPPHPERWRRPACPFCGVPAAATAARTGGSRTLVCVLCGGRWESAGLGCVACGDDRADRVRVLAAREAGPASLESCCGCGFTLKVFAAADLPPGSPVALELRTVQLDVLAARDEGVWRAEAARAAVFPPG
jgi:hypothetical protein